LLVKEFCLESLEQISRMQGIRAVVYC
jgi:hypothetical protein